MRRIAPLFLASLTITSIGCETKKDPAPSAASNSTSVAVEDARKTEKPSEVLAPEKLCALYMGLADPDKKMEAKAKELKEKRCLANAQGMRASNETAYKCLVECTQKAKDFAEARGCKKSCRGGKGGIGASGGGAPGGPSTDEGGLDDD